jgi:flagellar basal-body rod protein FlgC
MNDPLIAATRLAWSGISAQSARMKVVSENMANAESAGTAPGSDPYRRKTVSFDKFIDGDAETSSRIKVGQDNSAFRTEYRPGHPAADDKGQVKLPNVNMLIEMADMREAMRSYTANTQVIKQVREMISMTIDILRGT